MSRKGHNYFSILATKSGFEYVFRTGHDRWSTISPSFAKRILEKNKLRTSSKESKLAKDYLSIALKFHLHDSNEWRASKPIIYSTREEALKAEREHLDLSWLKIEGENDDKN